MWRNFSSKLLSAPEDFKIWKAIVLIVWVFAGFILAQVVIGLLLVLVRTLGVSFDAVNESTFQAVTAAIIYVLSLGIIIGVPWAIRRYRTTREEIGLTQLPTWSDILLSPIAFIVYIILSLILTTLASGLPFYNAEQIQDTGFTQLTHGFEYLLAFITLVVVAPVAEEILFRGYLLGKLRKHVPLWTAILLTSLLFGFIHFAWNVGVDVFALSIVLCILRVSTGRLWPSIMLHMLKNGIAFYFLFINPLL